MTRIISFLGGDSKVGNTMVVHSVGEVLSKTNPKLKILIIALSSKKNCEYVEKCNVYIKDLKLKINNKMLEKEDFLENTSKNKNVYFIGGIQSIADRKDYYPDESSYLLDVSEKFFDYILIDAGSELDQGLTIGGLKSSDYIMLVTTQNEVALAECEYKTKILKNMKIDVNGLIINKFAYNNPYDEEYIDKRLGGKNFICRIQFVEGAAEAERKRKTFVEMGRKKYFKDIFKIAKLIESRM